MAGSTADWGIFSGFMPPLPDRAVAIFESGGRESVRAMSESAGKTPAERPRVQVLVRGQPFDYQQARLKANDVFKVLDQLGETTVNSTRYLWMAAVQSPFSLGQDENNRPEIACNYDVVKELSTA